MTATVPPTTYYIYLRKYYLISTTFFNVTFVCSTKSRASAIFLLYTVYNVVFFHFSKDNCLLCQPFRQYLVVVSSFFFLQLIFAQFFLFQNCLKSANYLTIFTPVSYLRSFFFIFSKDNCLLRQPFRQFLAVVSPIFFLSANFCPVFSKSIFTPVIRLVVMLLFLIISASLFI